MKNIELTTVPSFYYPQGDVYDGGEQPIIARYYNIDLVELEQEGKTILIRKQDIMPLARLIVKHWDEANNSLNK